MLQITVELELLELVQTPKVESIIQRIWNSDYESSGSLMQLSTPWLIISNEINEDIEERNHWSMPREVEVQT